MWSKLILLTLFVVLPAIAIESTHEFDRADPGKPVVDAEMAPRASTVPGGLSTANGICYKIVRVEYIDLAGNNPHTNTTCQVINTSYTTPVVLTDIYVLGRGGVNDVMAQWGAYAGTVIPPLGRLDFRVSSNIPGVLPATTLADALNGPAASSVVVGWYGGSSDAVKLGATIERHKYNNDEDGGHIHVEGYEISP